jgi:hypothetical protein
MAFETFNQPIYVRQKHYIQETPGSTTSLISSTNGRRIGAISSTR